MKSKYALERAYLLLVDFVLPLPLTALMYYLWQQRTGNALFAAYVLTLGVVYGYVYPGIGTNLLRLWKFNGPLRIGNFHIHHGFMYAPYLALVFYVAFAPGTPLTLEHIVRTILCSAFIQIVISCHHNVWGVKTGMIEINNTPTKLGKSPLEIVMHYGVVGFGLIGASFAGSCSYRLPADRDSRKSRSRGVRTVAVNGACAHGRRVRAVPDPGTRAHLVGMALALQADAKPGRRSAETMSGMRVLLIGAGAPRLDDGKRPHAQRRMPAYAPTTLTTLAALIPPELDAAVVLIDEMIDPVPADFCGADLVAISFLTCDAPGAYQLAGQARAQNIPVVLGGYHVTFMPDEALQHADSIVKGFAEAAWPQLLRDFARGSMKKTYAADWQHEFSSSLAIPRRDLLNLKGYTTRNTLESSRGCLNQCAFCIVPPMHERQYVQRNVAQLTADIDSMPAGPLALLDPNPAENEACAAKLFGLLRESGRRWYSAASLRCAQDRNWAMAARKSGCKALVIGFESLNPDVLASEGKLFNDVARYHETCRMLHDEGIAILGCFVFGLDGEDASTFDRTVEFVNKSQMDLALYSAYTPFPGTAAWARLNAEQRIISTDWSLYDGRHVVFQPAGMTVEQLQNGCTKLGEKPIGSVPSSAECCVPPFHLVA